MNYKKINVCNISDVKEVLQEVQMRSKERTITASDIQAACILLEERFSDIPAKYKKGIQATIDINAQIYPRNYRYNPQSTQFTIIRGCKEWFIVSIFRGSQSKSSSKKFNVTLPQDTKNYIVNKSLEGFTRF